MGCGVWFILNMYSICPPFTIQKYHGKKSELGSDAAQLRKAYFTAKQNAIQYFEDILGETPKETSISKEGKVDFMTIIYFENKSKTDTRNIVCLLPMQVCWKILMVM